MRKLNIRQTLGLVLAGIAVSSCNQPGGDVFTLYRGSPLNASARIHMATFDAADTGDYNQRNCRITEGLYASQPGVTVRYWCEKGRYRP